MRGYSRDKPVSIDSLKVNVTALSINKSQDDARGILGRQRDLRRVGVTTNVQYYRSLTQPTVATSGSGNQRMFV